VTPAYMKVKLSGVAMNAAVSIWRRSESTLAKHSETGTSKNRWSSLKNPELIDQAQHYYVAGKMRAWYRQADIRLEEWWL